MGELERRFEWLAGEIRDLGNDVRLLQNHIDRLREALQTAQGEAYLGALDGDDTPAPLAACHSVIEVCLKALGPLPAGTRIPQRLP